MAVEAGTTMAVNVTWEELADPEADDGVLVPLGVVVTVRGCTSRTCELGDTDTAVGVGKELVAGDTVGYGTMLAVDQIEGLVGVSHGSVDDSRTGALEPDGYGGRITADVAVEVSNLDPHNSRTYMVNLLAFIS